MRHRPWLCLPPVLVAVFDVGLTLCGQSQAYWSGDYAATREIAPHARWLLRRHPAAFIAAASVYLVAVCAVITVAPRTLAKIVAVALVMGHVWGACTWLRYRYGVPYWGQLLFFLIVASITVIAFEQGEPRRGTSEAPG